MKDSNFDTSIYLPGLLDPGKVDGKQYLLPKDYSPLAVYYNKKLFDAATVPYPEDGWTWDDLLATAQKLTVKDALWQCDPVGHPAAGCLDDRL